jgi:hypothetical protein
MVGKIIKQEIKDTIMKYILPILVAFIAVTGCNKKDHFVDNENNVGSSRVTYFALLTLKGDPYMSVVKGGTFTDPGATATEKGTPINVTTSGTVNTSTPGLYILTYSAVNKDGFAATTTRTVAVIGAHEVPGTDISGTYDYVGSSVYEATFTKVAEGMYTADNCWSGATTIPCVFTTLDGVTISVPNQSTAFGPLNGSGTLSPTGLLTFSLNLPAQGVSNSTRKWQKQ